MKRWTVILGRVGTTVFAIGLAFFLVSLIPPTPTGGFISSGYVSKTWVRFYEGVLTPQQRLRSTFTANGTVNVYILEVASRTVYDWISEHNPGSVDYSNVTYFDQYLDSNSASVAWQNEIRDQTITYEYTPTKTVNITSVVSGHGPDVVSTNYDASILRSVAPTSKVQVLSALAISIGLVFTLPWLNKLLRAKKGQKS